MASSTKPWDRLSQPLPLCHPQSSSAELNWDAAVGASKVVVTIRDVPFTWGADPVRLRKDDTRPCPCMVLLIAPEAGSRNLPVVTVSAGSTALAPSLRSEQ